MAKAESKVETAEQEQMVPLSLVEKLMAEVEALKAQSRGLTPEGLEKILDKVGEKQTEAISTLRTALVPENKIAPGISAFSYPEGELARPKPRLKRETYFCDRRQWDDSLTPAEVDAFNAIENDCELYNGTWKAHVLKNGSKDVLRISVPCRDVDQRMSLPKSLTAILFELSNGTKPLDTNALLAQLSDLKEQLQRALAQQTAKA